MERNRRDFFLRLGVVTAFAGMAGAWASCGLSSRSDDVGVEHPGSAALGQKSQSQAESTFWVVLRDKADIAAAHKIKDRGGRGRFVVDHLKDAAKKSQAGVLAYLKGKGIAHQPHWIANVVRVKANGAVAKALEARPDVAAVIADMSFQIPPPVVHKGPAPTDAGWNISLIRANQVWSTFGSGEGIVIGSIDSGVEFTHEALVNQYRGNLGGGSFDHNYNWWDPSFICGPPGSPPCDTEGHGTHTMGTMVGGDGLGPFPNDIGVAPGARWMTAKGCESRYCSTEALLSSAEFMLAPTDMFGNNPDPARRPHVINNSWGDGPGNPFFRDIVVAWRAAGIFPVFSTGNPGSSCGAAGSPGDYPETFGVGATDGADMVAYFSGRGPSMFGVIKPDIMAPGVSILSSMPGGYGYLDGTSMAAPHVAGAVALLWSAAPGLVGDVPATFDLLRATAVDRPDLSCGGDSDGDPNNTYGEGRLDVFAAVSAAPRVAGTLEGVVTDASSGQPLPAALVRAIRSDDGAKQTTKSDETGHYSLRLAIDPAPGPEHYNVDVSAFGFVSASAGVDLQQDQTTAHDFALAQAPRFSLSGTVRDEAARPLAGAVVSILGTPIASVTTGPDGRYAFTGVPQGDYSLSAGERCHDGVKQAVSLNADQALDLKLSTHFDAAGYHCEAISLDYVTTSTGLNVSGDETVALTNLPFAFPFYGKVHESAYLSTNGLLNFQGYFYDQVNGAIPDPSAPNDAIYGFWDDLYVIDTLRADVYGTAPSRVWVLEYRNVYAFAEGKFTNFEVKLFERTGNVEVHYLPTPGGAHGSSATIGVESGDGTTAIQYAFNEPVIRDEGAAIRFVPPPAELVTGRILDANDGLPIAGATVRALQNGGAAGEASTDASGVYRLYLRLGNYTLEASAPRYPAISSDVALDQDDAVVTRDFALQTPRAEVSPAALELIVPVGSSRTKSLTLSNTGTLALTWDVKERAGKLTAAAPAGAGQWLSQSSTGVSLKSNLTAGGLAYPSSYRWQPQGAATGNVLVYSDDIVHMAPGTYIDLALQRLGLSYVAHYYGDYPGFETDLSAGPWDLVIFDNEAFFPNTSTLDALNSYVAKGGKLACTSVAVGLDPKHPLWSTLGIAWMVDDIDPPDPVYWWLPSHAVFTTPESVPAYTQLQPNRFYRNGQRVQALAGFEALAGYTPAPAPKDAALVLGNTSRTIFKSFIDAINDADRDADGTPDAMELWENIISGLRSGFFVDVPWVSESPQSGTLSSGQSTTVHVTVNAAGLPVGVYDATLSLLSQSGRAPSLQIPVRMIVSAYVTAVNAGGNAYTDVEGEPWGPDQVFATGGFGYMNAKAKSGIIKGDILGTVDDRLFESYREDPWEYRFDGVPPGVYQIELRFAEPLPNRGTSFRLFDVIVEGNLVLPSHDIAYEVGSQAADAHVFFAPVVDGQLNVRLVSRKGYQPAILSGVRVTHRPDR